TRALAAEGAAVVVAGRTPGPLEAVAAEIRAAGGRAWAVPAEVTDPESVGSLGRAARQHLGHVQILVNNAGVAHSARLDEITLDDWNRVLAVNATGTFLCTREFIASMIERRWGRVVNVASTAGLAGGRYIAAYSAAKHAVVGFTRSVAAEVARTGVTCNAVCPAFVDSELTRAAVERVVARTGRAPHDALAAVLASASQPRLIAPAEVAHAVLALCVRGSEETNGEAIVIDGRTASA
ncbi:MAG: SDR family NAD(P)-dependent oxidoreductase, partial [Gemmatimonadales bacterium]